MLHVTGHMIYAKKSLGQNFLSNPRILERIIEAGEVTPADTVLEIGPGTGNLTETLSQKAGRVIAVEKDQRLIEPLKEKFPAATNVHVIEGDILALPEDFFKTWNLETENYKVIANIPYYLTSHLLRVMLEDWPGPFLVVLMVQKEVAQRILATAPDMNLLALSVQFFATAELVQHVARGNFRPMPAVDSSVIKITPKATVPSISRTHFFALARAAFQEKRKQLANSLGKHLELDRRVLEEHLHAMDIPSTSRPEELSLGQWLTLTERLEHINK